MKYIGNFVLIVSFFLTYKLHSQTLEREVFMGLKLGTSSTEMQRKIESLALQGTFKKTGTYVYYVNNIDYSQKYYSLPLYFFNPGESLVSEIKVMYFDDLQWISSVVNNGIKGWQFLGLSSSPKYKDQVLSIDVFYDILNNLISKYGNPDKQSDITYEQNGKNVLIKRIWNNRNGVNIKLEFLTDVDKVGTNMGDSQIYLSYTYTKEMESKLNLRKSIY